MLGISSSEPKNQMKKGLNKRIALATKEGYDLIRVNDILYCQADGNYTKIFLKERRLVIVCKSIKYLEEALVEEPEIFRIHHSYIINLKSLMKYFKGDGGEVEMSDGKILNVSRARKEGLLQKIIDKEI